MRNAMGFVITVLLMISSLAGATDALADEALFVSKKLTAACVFTKGIEGPAVNVSGTLFIVNLNESGTIGKPAPSEVACELFAKLPKKDHKPSIGSGIRFDHDGRMYVADFKGNNIFVFDPAQNTPRVYFHSRQFHQPNDLAIASDGTLYASDP